MSDQPFCSDGCGRPATTERLDGMIGDSDDGACRGLFEVGEPVWHRDFGRCAVAETPAPEPPGIVYVTQGGRTERMSAGMLGRMSTGEEVQ